MNQRAAGGDKYKPSEKLLSTAVHNVWHSIQAPPDSECKHLTHTDRPRSVCVRIVKQKKRHACHAHTQRLHNRALLQDCSPLITTLLTRRQTDSPCLFICGPINLHLLLLTAPQSRPVSIPSTPDLAHLNASGRAKTAEKREQDSS